jgi:hypothetical protein
MGSDDVLYIEPPTDRTVGLLYGTKHVRYGPHVLGIRPRKGETDLVAGSKALLLAIIRQGDTHVSASLPSGKWPPHQSYCKRRTGSVAGRSHPSLGELDAATKQITLTTPLAGYRNEGVPTDSAPMAGIGILDHGFHGRAGNPGSTAPWDSLKMRTEVQGRTGRHNLTRMEMNEPINSGSGLQDEKVPRSANACRAWRSLYSNPRSLKRLTSMKTGSQAELQQATLSKPPSGECRWT